MLVDSWPARRWLMWPWCALRRHPRCFFLDNRMNGIAFEKISRCSCGQRLTRAPLSASSHP